MKDLLENRRVAQKLRRSATKEENHLWYDFLKTYPVQFKRQYQIGSYYVDFYCYQASLVIELDGSQHYTPEGQQYDQIRSVYLERQGLYILQIPNSDVWKNFKGVCQMIDMQVRNRME